MTLKKLFVFAASVLGASAALAQGELKTVSSVDLSRYAGAWYEIARKPMFYELGCVCSRQVLTPMTDGTFEVYNSCNVWSPDGWLRDVRGKASVDDKSTNAKLTVDFGYARKGEYWIIALDPNYRYAVVSDSDRRSLFVLAKTPTIAPALYAQAVAEAATQVDTWSLRLTSQEGCSYPALPQSI